MLEKGIGSLLRAKDQPQMLGSIQRFRTVSNQPFLNRGTVRRGVCFIYFGVRRFRTRKNAVAYFSSRKRNASESAAEKGLESARAACEAKTGPRI